jgi:hypothetical protein
MDEDIKFYDLSCKAKFNHVTTAASKNLDDIY